MSRDDLLDAATRAVTAKLTDEGRLIEAGWVGLRSLVLPADAPAIQIDEMRKAFFAGAEHLYSSILSVLDPGEEPTARDLDRMAKIDAELSRFRDALLAEWRKKS